MENLPLKHPAALSLPTSLLSLSMSYLPLEGLDLSKQSKLRRLYIGHTQIKNLDLSKTKVHDLIVESSPLRQITSSDTLGTAYFTDLKTMGACGWDQFFASLPAQSPTLSIGTPYLSWGYAYHSPVVKQDIYASATSVANGKGYATQWYNKQSYDPRDIEVISGTGDGCRDTYKLSAKSNLPTETRILYTEDGVQKPLPNMMPKGVEVKLEFSYPTTYAMETMLVNGKEGQGYSEGINYSVDMADGRFRHTYLFTAIRDYSFDLKLLTPTVTAAVTTSVVGEGTIAVTGFADLQAVPLGTELSVTATPKEGWELKQLTANGADITAAKKFVVNGATLVTATFVKRTFAVTTSVVGEGTIAVTGFADLQAVPLGTELSVTATPKEGWELKQLTANGADITAAKKFVVNRATTVVATFVKQTFAVTLKTNEHGTIAIAEKVDPNAVPYGTELTIVVTPKNDMCKLVKLTANGKDILATKQFTVTAATVVEAEFADYTSIDGVQGASLRVYPNPAKNFVIVEADRANAEIRLYSMDGRLLIIARTNAESSCRLDVSPLAAGEYLLRVGREQIKLSIQ